MIQEVIKSIDEAKKKRDFMHEQTEPNQMVLSQNLGKFEAVVTGNGDEKYLVPDTAGWTHYLYRGQNEEYVPSCPSLYRGEPDTAQIFLERMRLVLFKRMLDSHPVVNGFFRRHHFVIDVEGLAQHYGLKTEVMDLTSDLNVALFFATCKYDRATDSYSYFDDCKDHEAVLYLFDPIFDNEPSPAGVFGNYMRGNIHPIGLQAFPRPGVQAGYALHLSKGQSIKGWMYRFTFTYEDSKRYYDMFHAGEKLWVKDYLIAKTKTIAERMEFSIDVFKEAYELYAPKDMTISKLRKALARMGVTLSTRIKDIVFSPEEQQSIIDDWNNGGDANSCAKIVRKGWYKDIIRHPITKEPVQFENHQDYRTCDMIQEFAMLHLCEANNTPLGAVWKNYTNKPAPPRPIRKEDGQWREILGNAVGVIGKPWLTEADWRI